ncbi:unnamed protein product [Tetraodon nigroviridis]|uniref:V-ATPase 14 kDa subunit n=1 Tax=Tetraodon nigroviridis TaxID=99883 RepID=Q4TH57_TETNG|nr:unnamed protein product [Tetraodon nigroviridis]
MAARGKLIAVIGDEDTCTGFLLGGIGELNKNRKPNFLVVEKDTSITEIEETFKSFLARRHRHHPDQPVHRRDDPPRHRRPHAVHPGRAGDPVQGAPLRRVQGLHPAPGQGHVLRRGLPIAVQTAAGLVMSLSPLVFVDLRGPSEVSWDFPLGVRADVTDVVFSDVLCGGQ